MANISFNGAVDAIMDELDWRNDDILSDVEGRDEDTLFEDLMEIARDALEQYIDSGLVYTSDILELWDGCTHENVVVEDSYTDLMRLVTQSTFFQLEEEWNDAIYDGIDRWLFDVTGERDRADALDKIVNA